MGEVPFPKVLFMALVMVGFDNESMAMGSKLPAPPASPAPIVLSPMSDSPNTKVWYGSNVGTPDLLTMFEDLSAWTDARGRLSVFQFYAQQLLADETSQCPMCENNILPNLVSRGAFSVLKSHGIQVAVEKGSVKDWDCDARKNEQIARDLFQRMKNVGAQVDIIAMDEPYVSGVTLCKMGEDPTAVNIARYAQNVRASSLEIQSRPVSIGMIEAYPHFDVNAVERHIIQVTQAGADIDFLHLDVDRNAIKNQKIDDARLARELQHIWQLCQDRNIEFGVIFWGQEGKDAIKYRSNVMDWVIKEKKLVGRPDHVIFQSWEQGDSSGQVRRVPNNLPETDIYSHTRVMIDGLFELQWVPGSVSH